MGVIAAVAVTLIIAIIIIVVCVNHKRKAQKEEYAVMDERQSNTSSAVHAQGHVNKAFQSSKMDIYEQGTTKV